MPYIKITESGHIVIKQVPHGRPFATVAKEELGGRLTTYNRNRLQFTLSGALPKILLVNNAAARKNKLPINDLASACLRYASEYILGDAIIAKIGASGDEDDIEELNDIEADLIYECLTE